MQPVTTRNQIFASNYNRSFKLDTRNNRDFGDAMIRSVFDEVSGAI